MLVNSSVKFVFFITFFGFSSYAQEMQTKLENYLPPSPTAQEFLKYGEYPVSFYTGVPEISIPLYEVVVNSLKVPISISYHSSGIEVDQQSTWVGLGWSLNAGGVITRVPKGVPDDTSNGFLNVNLPEVGSLVYNDIYFEQAATGETDTESDIYYYNIGGISGEFFFGRDKKIRLINEAPIRIIYNSGGFVVTLSDGTIFEFYLADAESTQSSVNSEGGSNFSNYISTWNLSKLSSPSHGAQINFQYENGGTVLNKQFTYVESTGNYLSSTFPPQVISNVHHLSSLASQVVTQTIPKRLKEISFPNGKVVFNRVNDRMDRVGDRLSEVIVYSRNRDLTFSKLKSFSFLTSHFYSSQTNIGSQEALGGSNDPRRYRLRLDELVEYDKDGVNPLRHQFEYNSTMLPPIETNSKDFWGYYNGKNNSTLIPLQPFLYIGQQVGTADRNPDELYMKAGVLEKITYPTGGFTKFLHEPHEYASTDLALVTSKKAVSARGDSNPFYQEVTFTPTTSGYASVYFESSDMIDSQGGIYPRITLKAVNESGYLIDHRVDPYNYSFPLNPPTIEQTFSSILLNEGQTYVLKVEVKGSSSSNRYNGAAFINGEITYEDISTELVNTTKIAGGLRIKEIQSYTKENEFAFAKRYEYLNSGLITPENFLNEQYLDIEIQGWKHDNGYIPGQAIGGCAAISTIRRFYYGGTVRSLTLSGGSPVIYGEVEEIQINLSGQELGKTIYSYSTHEDVVFQTFNSYEGGLMLFKKDWTGGQLLKKEIFKNSLGSGSTLIYSEENDYVIARDKVTVATDAYKMYKIVHSRRIFGDCRLFEPDQFDIIEYPIYSGVKLLKKTHIVNKDNYSNTFDISNELFYDNEVHLNVTRKQESTSNGQPILTKIFYPDDISSANSLEGGQLLSLEYNAINTLKSDVLHRVDTPIQIEKWRGGQKLESKRISFKEWEDGIVEPEVIKTSFEGNPFESRIRYYEYGDNGKPHLVSMENGMNLRYIWGYSNEYLVAQIENSSNGVIAYSSFETSDKGGWVYSGTINTATYKTGKAAYNLGTGSITKTGIGASATTPYKVGFWARRSSGTGNVSVGGQTEALTTAWKWVEKTITTSSLTISGSSVIIDELRLHPMDAMMTSFTYEPLVGMLSKTDPRGYTLTYLYDAANRLMTIKDENGNILEHFEYNYAN